MIPPGGASRRRRPDSFINMKSFKKVFSSFVSLTTILWSVGGTLAFPNVARAATLNPGDLIKASGPAVYYYAADGKRYVFPNEKTYFSWYTDFSSVKTITDAELAAVTIGGNITIRPGTKLVKITTDPKVYAVTGRCAVLHWLESETLAKQLYGDNWAQRVVDVPDSFFVNYAVGSSVSTPVHPDGQLVSYAGDTNKYVVWNGKKRNVLAAGMTANKLDGAIPTTITYLAGADVTGYEADLGDVACAGAVAPVTGSVSVALASDTPAGATVPRNSSSVALAKVNLTAGSADSIVNGLRFHRVGTGAATDFANVYLYDQNKVRLTTGRTINSTTHTVEFNSLGIKVAAGTTVALYVYGDFSVAAGSTGGQHAMELSDAASVVISGTGTVSGSFPVRGNVFVVGTTAAARVDINAGVQPTNPTIGTKAAEISNFRITANTNDIEVRQVTLYQAGSITNTDLANFKLWQGTTVVATGGAVSAKNLITLTFDPPFVITNGTTKTFKLTADVAGRAARTIITYVEYTTDVTAIDKVYGSGAAICIAATAIGGCTLASQGSFDGTTTAREITVTTQGGQLTVAFNGPPTTNVAKGTLSVPLFKVTLTSPDNALEIRKVTINLAAGDSAGVAKVKGSSATEYFRNFRLIDLNTKQTVMGPIGMPSTVASGAVTTGDFSFTDSWNLNSGQTRDLAVVADLSNSEDVTNQFFGSGTSTYKLTFVAFGSTDVRVVDTGEFLATTKIVPNTAIIGNALTVKASSLTVSLATTPTGTTIVKKQQGVPAVGFSLSAGQQSDVTVTSIKLTGRAQTAFVPSYTLAKFAQLVTLLTLWDGATQVGLAKAPDSTTGDAQITNMSILIPKGTTKTLVAKVTLASTVSSTTSTDQFAIGIAAAADVTSQDQDANSITASLDQAVIDNSAAASQTVIQSVRNSGTITYQQDSHPQTTILVAGGSAWKVLARFKATTLYEAATLDRVRIQHPADGGVNGDFAMIAVAQGGDVTNRQDTLAAGSSGSKDIDMTVNPIKIAKDGAVQFEIWAKLAALSSTSSATTNSPRTGNNPALGVVTSTTSGEWDTNYTNQINIRATGDASGERLYATSTNGLYGNAMVLRKTKPTVTKLAVATNTLSSGSDMELYKFQVTPDASGGSVAWMQVMFTVTTSSNVTNLSTFRLYKGSTPLSITAGSAEVFIRDAVTGGDLTGSTGLGGHGRIVVRLVNEESVTGSGTVYTLRATPVFTGTGNTVSTQFYRSSGGTVTGYITDGDMGGALGIDTSVGGATTNGAAASGTFLWSDNMDVPHSFASGSNSGSRDWSNDVLLEDLTQSQTISN